MLDNQNVMTITQINVCDLKLNKAIKDGFVLKKILCSLRPIMVMVKRYPLVSYLRDTIRVNHITKYLYSNFYSFNVGFYEVFLSAYENKGHCKHYPTPPI